MVTLFRWKEVGIYEELEKRPDVEHILDFFPLDYIEAGVGLRVTFLIRYYNGDLQAIDVETGRGISEEKKMKKRRILETAGISYKVTGGGNGTEDQTTGRTVD